MKAVAAFVMTMATLASLLVAVGLSDSEPNTADLTAEQVYERARAKLDDIVFFQERRHVTLYDPAKQEIVGEDTKDYPWAFTPRRWRGLSGCYLDFPCSPGAPEFKITNAGIVTVEGRPAFRLQLHQFEPEIRKEMIVDATTFETRSISATIILESSYSNLETGERGIRLVQTIEATITELRTSLPPGVRAP
jgi:hypothetical protein